MNLNSYLSVRKECCDKIFDKIEHSNNINGVDVNLRFQYIKFDPNGEPKMTLLIDTLVNLFTHYCFSAQKRQIDTNLSESDQEQIRNKLHTNARKLFRKWKEENITEKNKPTSGELGEMILWLFMEALLEAPQMVAKMDLKTNPHLESFGSDGIHMKVVDNILNVFFGEAKLYRDISAALTSVFSSLENFHSNYGHEKKHELKMVTTHYKYLQKLDQDKVFDYINDSLGAEEVKINHVCLVGYDWNMYDQYKGRKRHEFLADFIADYKSDTARLTSLIQKKFDGFKKKNLDFEVFFMPVESVQALRNLFNEEL